MSKCITTTCRMHAPRLREPEPLRGETPEQMKSQLRRWDVVIESPAMKALTELQRLSEAFSKRIDRFLDEHDEACSCSFCVFMNRVATNLRGDLNTLRTNVEMGPSLATSEGPFIA